MGKRATYGIQAETLYVREGKSLTEISKILPIRIQTLSNWKKKGEWDRKRDAFMRSSIVASEMLLEEAVSFMRKRKDSKEPLSPKEADAIVKIISSAKKLEEKSDFPGTALVVLGELMRFLKDRDREAAKALDRNIQDFSQYIWEKYKGPNTKI